MHSPCQLLDQLWNDCRVALWNGLLRSCNQACKMFANGYAAEGEAKEPILDFFGVSVKAEDIPQQVERMYLLKKKVCDLDLALSKPRHLFGKSNACFC